MIPIASMPSQKYGYYYYSADIGKWVWVDDRKKIDTGWIELSTNPGAINRYSDIGYYYYSAKLGKWTWAGITGSEIEKRLAGLAVKYNYKIHARYAPGQAPTATYTKIGEVIPSGYKVPWELDHYCLIYSTGTYKVTGHHLRLTVLPRSSLMKATDYDRLQREFDQHQSMGIIFGLLPAIILFTPIALFQAGIIGTPTAAQASAVTTPGVAAPTAPVTAAPVVSSGAIGGTASGTGISLGAIAKGLTTAGGIISAVGGIKPKVELAKEPGAPDAPADLNYWIYGGAAVAVILIIALLARK